MYMGKLIILNELEHFSLTFANETLLFDVFGFGLFTVIASPIFCLVKTGIIAVFMDLNFARNA